MEVYTAGAAAVRPVLVSELSLVAATGSNAAGAADAAGGGAPKPPASHEPLTPPELSTTSAALAAASYHEPGLQRLFLDASRPKLRELRMSEHADLMYACAHADVAAQPDGPILRLLAPNGSAGGRTNAQWSLLPELFPEMGSILGKASSLTTQATARLSWTLATHGVDGGSPPSLSRLLEEIILTLQPSARIQHLAFEVRGTRVARGPWAWAWAWTWAWAKGVCAVDGTALGIV